MKNLVLGLEYAVGYHKIVDIMIFFPYNNYIKCDFSHQGG